MRDLRAESIEYHKKLGQLVREAREKRGLIARQVAYYTGIDQANLSRFERGLRKLSPENIKRLLEYLNIDVTHLGGAIEIVAREKEVVRVQAPPEDVGVEFKMVQCPKCLTRQKVYFPR